MVVSITQLLRTIGMLDLYVFFFAYGIGGALGIGQYYLLFIYTAIVIAGFIICCDTSCLFRYRQYFIWMFLFIVFQACTLTYTINTENGFPWLTGSIKIVFKITAVAIICNDITGVKKLFKGLAYLGGIVFVTLLVTGHLHEGWRLGTDLLGNANSFAMVILFYAVGAMVSFFSEQALCKKIVYGLLLCIDIYMIFLSGGRKFLLFIVVFVYASLVFGEKHVNIKNVLLGTVVVGLLIYIGYKVIMTVPSLYNSIGIRLIGLGSEEGAMGVDDQVSIMQRGLNMFLQKPIFGWGIAGVQKYHGIYYGKSFYAHSNYVELLADYGLVGTLLYLSQYIRIFNRLCIYNDVDLSERRIYLPLLISVILLDVFAVTFNQTAFVPLFIMLMSGAQCSQMANAEIIEEQTERCIPQKRTSKYFIDREN